MKISGKSLKLALRGAGLTQEEAAKRLNVTRQTVGNWVNRDELDPDVLQKVKYNLEIDLQNANNFTTENKTKLTNSQTKETMNDPQKKIYENYIEKLEMENTQLRQELDNFKQVKGKSCVS